MDPLWVAERARPPGGQRPSTAADAGVPAFSTLDTVAGLFNARFADGGWVVPDVNVKSSMSNNDPRRR